MNEQPLTPTSILTPSSNLTPSTILERYGRHPPSEIVFLQLNGNIKKETIVSASNKGQSSDPSAPAADGGPSTVSSAVSGKYPKSPRVYEREIQRFTFEGVNCSASSGGGVVGDGGGADDARDECASFDKDDKQSSSAVARAREEREGARATTTDSSSCSENSVLVPVAPDQKRNLNQSSPQPSSWTRMVCCALEMPFECEEVVHFECEEVVDAVQMPPLPNPAEAVRQCQQEAPDWPPELKRVMNQNCSGQIYLPKCKAGELLASPRTEPFVSPSFFLTCERDDSSADPFEDFEKHHGDLFFSVDSEEGVTETRPVLTQPPPPPPPPPPLNSTKSPRKSKHRHDKAEKLSTVLEESIHDTSGGVDGNDSNNKIVNDNNQVLTEMNSDNICRQEEFRNSAVAQDLLKDSNHDNEQERVKLHQHGEEVVKSFDLMTFSPDDTHEQQQRRRQQQQQPQATHSEDQSSDYQPDGSDEGENTPVNSKEEELPSAGTSGEVVVVPEVEEGQEEEVVMATGDETAHSFPFEDATSHGNKPAAMTDKEETPSPSTQTSDARFEVTGQNIKLRALHCSNGKVDTPLPVTGREAELISLRSNDGSYSHLPDSAKQSELIALLWDAEKDATLVISANDNELCCSDINAIEGKVDKPLPETEQDADLIAHLGGEEKKESSHLQDSAKQSELFVLPSKAEKDSAHSATSSDDDNKLCIVDDSELKAFDGKVDTPLPVDGNVDTPIPANDKEAAIIAPLCSDDTSRSSPLENSPDPSELIAIPCKDDKDSPHPVTANNIELCIADDSELETIGNKVNTTSVPVTEQDADFIAPTNSDNGRDSSPFPDTAEQYESTASPCQHDKDSSPHPIAINDNEVCTGDELKGIEGKFTSIPSTKQVAQLIDSDDKDQASLSVAAEDNELCSVDNSELKSCSNKVNTGYVSEAEQDVESVAPLCSNHNKDSTPHTAEPSESTKPPCKDDKEPSPLPVADVDKVCTVDELKGIGGKADTSIPVTEAPMCNDDKDSPPPLPVAAEYNEFSSADELKVIEGKADTSIPVTEPDADLPAPLCKDDKDPSPLPEAAEDNGLCTVDGLISNKGKVDASVRVPEEDAELNAPHCSGEKDSSPLPGSTEQSELIVLSCNDVNESPHPVAANNNELGTVDDSELKAINCNMDTSFLGTERDAELIALLCSGDTDSSPLPDSAKQSELFALLCKDDKDSPLPVVANDNELMALLSHDDDGQAESEWKTPVTQEVFRMLEVDLAPSDELENRSLTPTSGTEPSISTSATSTSTTSQLDPAVHAPAEQHTRSFFCSSLDLWPSVVCDSEGLSPVSWFMS